MFRRIISALLIATLVTVGSAATVSASEAQTERVAACGDTINAQYISCLHQRHGHHQYQGGRGTPQHTWARYQYEARMLRRYLIALYVAAVQRQQQANLVSNWQGVANCESGGNWAINTGNGYYGGLQFNLGTWRAYGGPGMPHEQSAFTQATIAERVRTGSQGLGAWPHCGRYYG